MFLVERLILWPFLLKWYPNPVSIKELLESKSEGMGFVASIYVSVKTSFTPTYATKSPLVKDSAPTVLSNVKNASHGVLLSGGVKPV